MESSLHRQLKEIYAGSVGQVEATLGAFRIDVISDDELIEIQHGSLAAIREKVRGLLDAHRVRVVKPIIARKRLIKQDAKGGRTISQRMSPKRGTILDLFDELIYFTRVFPHERLRLEVPLVDVEEIRYPGHGKRRRRRANDHQVEDQRLVKIHETYHFGPATDLLQLLPKRLPVPFHTGQLSQALGIPRWVAQRMTYCLRKMGAARVIGKSGNARLYALCS